MLTGDEAAVLALAFGVGIGVGLSWPARMRVRRLEPALEIPEMPPAKPSAIRNAIQAEGEALTALLLRKNAGYGNSALDPIRVFSRADRTEQIRVRCDDKLSRIKRGKLSPAQLRDTLRDLAGYCLLLIVAEERNHGSGEK